MRPLQTGRYPPTTDMAQLVSRLTNLATVTAPALAQKSFAFSKPKLQTFWKYAKVELAPPKPSEISEAVNSFNKLVAAGRTQKWRQLTVKEAFVNTLVGVEVACWFFVGEIIGKGSLVGYKIDGAYNTHVHL